ncbi:hypothetical protein PRZ48_004978 [Zasmidium cellare]|uniref:RING-type E3 ubiquitin transferase n=1 Tax=Zasmidium cellare TaxID=395010 RepID=A0ABR0ES86_ZASCE|nr:hypothetical protein PRZ48_004978 [Zasmidium cellare]
MSISAIPSNGLTLHGLAAIDEDPKHEPNPAILFRLNDSLLEDVKKASSSQGGLQLLTGAAPKIRLGKRTIDLTISPEAFRHELYTASTDSLSDFDFAGIVSHRAELKAPERKQSLGSDAALAALQSSLKSYQQEKQAKSVNISNNLVAVPKHRWEANKQQQQAKRRGLAGSHSASPLIGSASAPHVGSAPTSVPAGESFARAQAMKTPLLHLLAIKPLSTEDIIQKTHIPQGDLEEIVQKIGKQDSGKWQLTDRSYRDLDLWKFGYSTQKERDAAIENAIRAYDRMRLGKDEKLWQMLLREEERDKGKILSKLHLGGGPSKLTPNLAASPMPEDGQAISASNTPRLGPSSTPKVGTKKNEAGSFEKKLFANKDPKKRAIEEAKEKKRKEKETAAASDREGGKPARKKQTTAKNNPKVKSEELVHSSSDESEGETRRTPAQSSSQPKAAATDRKPLANATAKKQTTAATTTTLSQAAAKVKSKAAAEGTGTPKAGTPASKQSSATKAAKSSTAGKNTPNGLSAPASQHRTQLSPQKPGSRPGVPSPLGAARPRVASDVSDRSAVGVQRVRQGAETVKGLGITNGFRKRQDTVTSTESYLSSNSDKMNGDHKTNADKARKQGANGTVTSKSSLANGHAHKGENGVKRKTADSPSQAHEDGHAAKHRKTESNSSQSQKSRNGSIGATSSTEAPLERSTSSDSTGSIINDITYSQGVNIAQKFRDEYYPAYAKLYDEQAAMEKRGETVPRHDRQRLWDMHKRLEQMKREIKAASLREHLDE